VDTNPAVSQTDRDVLDDIGRRFLIRVDPYGVVTRTRVYS
jgi:hypothetical protein